jgi:hypothetical protein
MLSRTPFKRGRTDVPRGSLGDACSLGLASSSLEQASDVRSRLELEFTELSRLAREHERGWNRLAAYIVGHCRGEI